MDNFREHLPPPIADDVIAALVRAVILGYEDASVRFDPVVGCDSNTFGTEVWRFIWYRLEQELWFIPGVRTTRADGSFAILVGDVIIRAYRGGSEGNYNIHEFNFAAGSKLRRDTPWQNYEQLTLFSQDSELALDQAAVLTVVHTGNPKAKCTGVWVGLPFPEGWRWVDRLYELEAAEDEAPLPTGFTPFNERDEPDVRVDLLSDDDQEADDADVELREDTDDDDEASSSGEEDV